MSFAFIATACVFALVVGCAVAFVDRWREGRLAAPRLRPVVPVAVQKVATSQHRRAA